MKLFFEYVGTMYYLRNKTSLLIGCGLIGISVGLKMADIPVLPVAFFAAGITHAILGGIPLAAKHLNR